MSPGLTPSLQIVPYGLRAYLMVLNSRPMEPVGGHLKAGRAKSLFSEYISAAGALVQGGGGEGPSGVAAASAGRKRGTAAK